MRGHECRGKRIRLTARTLKFMITRASRRCNFWLKISRVQKQVAGNLIARSRLLSASLVSPTIDPRELRGALELYGLAELQNLASLLRGKRVVLIGPGSTGTPISELRKFDVIARLGFTGADSSMTPGFTECDISFLARWHASHLVTKLGDQNPGVAKTTKLMLRWDVWEKDEVSLKPHFQISRFSISPCDRLFGEVTPNFAPHAILWLLACQPKELHLTHVDLFTQAAYSSGYVFSRQACVQGDTLTRPTSEVRRSFAQFHNPFTHFDFFQSLKSLDEVSFSETLASVICQGKRAYRKRIADLYFSKAELRAASRDET